MLVSELWEGARRFIKLFGVSLFPLPLKRRINIGRPPEKKLK